MVVVGPGGHGELLTGANRYICARLYFWREPTISIETSPRPTPHLQVLSGLRSGLRLPTSKVASDDIVHQYRPFPFRHLPLAPRRPPPVRSHDKLLGLANDLHQAQREEKQEMSESHYQELEAALFKIVARGMKRSAKKIAKVANDKDLEKKKRMQMLMMTVLS